MALRAELAVFLLLFVATVKCDEAGVEFWRKNFTMTCPKNGTWHKDSTFLQAGEIYRKEYENKLKGLYYCEYVEEEDSPPVKIKYYFYVQGKVCENCFELDGTLLGFAIALDALVTGTVMIIIFRCVRERSSARPSHSPKAPVRSGGRGPAQPSDYEELNPHTRSQDPYSVVNRMG